MGKLNISNKIKILTDHPPPAPEPFQSILYGHFIFVNLIQNKIKGLRHQHINN